MLLVEIIIEISIISAQYREGRLIKGSFVGQVLRSGDNMAQGLYQHVRATWKRPKDALPHMYRQARMAQWRREPVNCKIDRPTRLDAARRMGYKAKQGVVLVRTRVRRGGLRKGKIHMKRKPSKAGISKITMAKNTQRIAEERVARHFPNLEVLNSYWVGQDGKHKYFEVIMIDTHHPAIINDKQLGVCSVPLMVAMLTRVVFTVVRPLLVSEVVVYTTRVRAQKSYVLL